MSELIEVHASLLKNHKSGVTRPYNFRMKQLKGVKQFLINEEKVIAEALRQDLHRSDFEAVGVEITTVLTELNYAIKHLHEWMEPIRTPVAAMFAPASSEIHHEPFGLCLILGAFNYPITLTLSPLIGAIAAGNSAIIKPSEMTPATEAVLRDLLPKYLDANYYRIVTGDIPVTTQLLSLRWDKIFFTGSTRVGRIVLEAAAKYLTPVSLELGGKSPTIVDESVGNLELAATRIAWGKNVNAGQTCIAPDYIFVHEKHYEKFLQLLKQKTQEFYGQNIQQSADFSRIVSDAHFKRLHALLDDSKDHVYAGGETDAIDRYIEPTILTNLDRSKAKVMQEEIFGPLLPVFRFSQLDEVISYVNEGEKPLTMYIFARNSKVINRLQQEVPSGSIVTNDCLFQFANHFAPFGGVGFSGMGGYRGKFSFEAFSQKRSILRRDDHKFLDIPIRYPPYTKSGLNFFKFAALYLPDIPPLPRFKWRYVFITLGLGFGVSTAIAYKKVKRALTIYNIAWAVVQYVRDHILPTFLGGTPVSPAAATIKN